MRITFLIAFICVATASTAQRIKKYQKVNEHSTYVIGTNFEGAIFGDRYKDVYLLPDEVKELKRMTPSISDIEATEKIMQKEIGNVDKGFKYPSGKYVKKNLRKTLRQYVGFVNSKGETIIFIHCFKKHDSYDDGEWRKEYLLIMDGGASVWQVVVNLATRKLSSFGINGMA